MSLTILDQLEEKIKQAVETIQLLQLELEDLKEQKLEFINEEDSEKILLREGFYFIDKYKSIFLKNYLNFLNMSPYNLIFL